MNRHLFVFFLVVIFCNRSEAQPTVPTIPVQNIKYWKPQDNHLWSNPANWQPFGVPNALNAVVIERPANDFQVDTIVIDIAAFVYSIQTQSAFSDPKQLVIIQNGDFKTTNGFNFLSSVWSMTPGNRELVFENSGITVMNFGWFESDGHMLFHGPVFFNRTANYMAGKSEYFSDIHIGKYVFDNPVGLAILRGRSRIFTEGYSFNADEIQIAGELNFVNNNNRDLPDANSPVLLGRKICLKSGRLSGSPAFFVVEEGELVVDPGYKGLETSLEIFGTNAMVSINGPLLSTDTSELILGSSVVTLTATVSDGLQLGDGKGKLRIRNGASVSVGTPDATFKTTDFILEGGTYTAPSKNMSLTGNLTNDGEFKHNMGRLTFTGGGISRIGGTASTNFHDLSVDKPNEGMLLVNGSRIAVAGWLLLKTGKLGGNASLELSGSVKASSGFVSAVLPMVFTQGQKQFVDFSEVPGLWDGKVEFRKTSTDSIILQSRWVLDAPGQSLQFVKGIVYSSANHLLELGPTTVAVGGNDNSYVNGPVQKTGNNAFSFPLGDKGKYAPVRISGNGHWAKIDNVGTYTAQYYNENPQAVFGGNVIAPLKKVSSREYWQITRQSGGAVSVWLSYSSTRSGAVDGSEIRVAGFDATNIAWKEKGNLQVINGGVKYVGIANKNLEESIYTLGSTVASVNFRTSDQRIDVSTAKSLTDDIEQLSVYPNPAVASTRITLINTTWRASKVNVAIMDGSGALVWQEIVSFDNSGRGSIPIGRLSRGIYYIRGTAGEKTVLKQIVVQ